MYIRSSQMKVCGQYGTRKTECHLLNLILIPTVAKLFANQNSIRNSLQKSDLSWCWRDVVTLKDLHGVTWWLRHHHPSPAAIHTNHKIAQHYSDRRLLQHLLSTISAVNNTMHMNVTQWLVFQLAVNDATQTDVTWFIAINYCHLRFRTVLVFITCRVQLKPDVTRWRTRGEVKGKLANGVGSQYSSHYFGTWCIQYYYHYYRWCAHLGSLKSTELTPPPI